MEKCNGFRLRGISSRCISRLWNKRTNCSASHRSLLVWIAVSAHPFSGRPRSTSKTLICSPTKPVGIANAENARATLTQLQSTCRVRRTRIRQLLAQRRASQAAVRGRAQCREVPQHVGQRHDHAGAIGGSRSGGLPLGRRKCTTDTGR